MPGAVIVKFREVSLQPAPPPTDPGRAVRLVDPGRAAAEAVAREHGLAYEKPFPALGVHLLQAAPGEEIAAVRRLQADGRVEFAEPDYMARAASHLIPSDPFYAIGQRDLDLIRMPDAWHITTGSSAVATAVLDTGIDLAHPDLDTRIVRLTGFGPPGQDHVFLTPNPLIKFPACPAVTPEDDGWRGTEDSFSHGTHVAGTIAAKTTIAGDPAEGIAGIAPGTMVAPLKVLDCEKNGRFSDIADAMIFASNNGARIINLSIGSDGDQPACFQVMQLAIDEAVARGVFIVAAAGNDGTANRSVPANCEHVVAVGATDNSDARASFSQFNGTVDLVAPGVNTVGPVRAPDGSRAWLLSQGTSMATAHVAGCAALVRSAAPALTPGQVEVALENSAKDLGPPGRDDEHGFGRLNCGAAVEAAASGRVPLRTPTPTATRTPTPTASAGAAAPTPTAPPSTTAGPTATAAKPTAPTATPRPTGTPAPALVGGRGFTLRSLGGGRVELSWQGGDAQSGYNLTRLAGPSGGAALPGTALSYTETLPPGEPSACYVLLVMGRSRVIASSDVLCVAPRIASGVAPGNLSIQLNQGPTAALAWTPPGGQTDYILVPLGMPRRAQIRPGLAVSAADDTGGAPTCYVVAARTGPAVTGISDIVCGIPGLSSGLG